MHWCGFCEKYPFGFLTPCDLRRHHNSFHAPDPEVWICADPVATDSSHKTDEGWRPIRPLGNCLHCKELRMYKSRYDAVNHLRRIHFCPTGQARRADGVCPSVTWLKEHGWLKKHRWSKGVKLRHAVCGDIPAMVGEKENGAISNTDNRGDWSWPKTETSINSHRQQYPFSPGGCSQTSIPYVSHSDSIPLAKPTMTTQQWTVHAYQSSKTQLPTVTQNFNAEAVLPDGGSETTSDMSENCYAESETSTGTVLDNELLLTRAGVSRVARSRGTWFVDLEYEDLWLSREFFAHVLLSNPRLSRLAYVADFPEDGCQVRWRSESIALLEAELPKVYTELVEQLDALCSKQDGVQWYANDSAYTIEGSNESHHLCLRDRCEGCAIFSSVIGSLLGG